MRVLNLWIFTLVLYGMSCIRHNLCLVCVHFITCAFCTALNMPYERRCTMILFLNISLQKECATIITVFIKELSNMAHAKYQHRIN